MGSGSADYLHLLTEAKKLAFADRAKFYADPFGQRLPTAELISKEYAARQQKRIDMVKAATDVPAGDPKLVHGDTIYLTVVDKDRNCCSFIQSVYYGFGSQVVPGNVGFAMQNRGALFALDDTHLNRLEPHKRPFHTIIPAMVTKEGKPWFCFGVMGGDMQPQGHVQVLVNLIDFGMNVQQAGDAARVQHSGSATPTGLPMQAGGGVRTRDAARRDRAAQGRGGGRVLSLSFSASQEKGWLGSSGAKPPAERAPSDRNRWRSPRARWGLRSARPQPPLPRQPPRAINRQEAELRT
jgi:gamma-glutamyltranspeptidase / glutathione hydrolase